MRSSSVPAVVLVMAASLSASSCVSRNCTEVGAFSEVVFTFSAVPAAGAPWEVRACVEDVCDSGTVPADAAPSFSVRDDALTSDTPVSTELRVVDAAGTTLVDGSLVVTPEVHDPNGAGCAPRVWVADVVVGAGGSLEQQEIDARGAR